MSIQVQVQAIVPEECATFTRLVTVIAINMLSYHATLCASSSHKSYLFYICMMIFVDVDHEMETHDQVMRENNIVKLLDVSLLSDTTCVAEDHESECCVPHSDASSPPAINKMPSSNTPQSEGIRTGSRTSSVSESQGSASVSAYEDALADLSSTKTPVLPTRSKITPLLRSARKVAQSGGK